MNIKTLITFIAITLGVLLGVGGMLWQFGQSGATKPVEGVAGEMRYVKGSGEIVVTEFSDFQCPGCAQAQPKIKEILVKYEGRVKLVYRYFPLTSIHKNAMMAAQTAESAHLQGKFWEMHDVLFAKQNEWSGLTDPKSKFLEYAKELGIDVDKLQADWESEAVKQVVAKDLADATRFRLRGTPSFFVNGIAGEIDGLEALIAKQ